LVVALQEVVEEVKAVPIPQERAERAIKVITTEAD